MALPHSVTTMTPLRLSFAGGATDIESFYREHGGAVVSTALDKHIYVTIRKHSPLFGEQYRLSYSEVEHTQSREAIRNDIIRECLGLVPVDGPLYIATGADLPAFSGLGSSSSFAVGLLHGLHVIRGEHVSAGQLAEEACHVEIDLLAKPIGRQDQYAAAFGGLNYIAFGTDGRVTLDPIHAPCLGRLFDHALLFWTGQTRKAELVLADVAQNLPDATGRLKAMTVMAGITRDMFLQRPLNIEKLGEVLNAGWLSKRSLADSVSNSMIDAAYLCALDNGAYGGKVCGAGGGGFLFLLAPPERHESLRVALGMADVAIRHEPRGSRVLSMV